MIHDWSIDFEKTKSAAQELKMNRLASLSSTRNNNDDDDNAINTHQKATVDDDDSRLLFLQHQIIAANPIGRHLLSHQLKNVFDTQGRFIYNPRSLKNLPVIAGEEENNNNTKKNKNNKSSSSSPPDQNVVVLLSGALNPVHRAHTKAALLGARAIEEQFGIEGHHASFLNTDNKNKKQYQTHKFQKHDTLFPGKVKVIGCALVPSSDGYVLSKLGKGEALKCTIRCEFTDDACVEETKEYLNHVVKFCLNIVERVSNIPRQEKDENNNDTTNNNAINSEKVIKQAIENEELDPFFPLICLDYNQASAGWCCKLLEKELRDEYNGGVPQEDHQNNNNNNNNNNNTTEEGPHHFKALRLYGSDFCKKYRQYRDMICIARHDSEKSGQYVQKIVEKGTEVGENFIFVPQDPNRDVFAGNAHCSSSLIREALLNSKDKNESLSQMLHRDVCEKMIKITTAKMEHEKKVAEERKKKEELIAFHKNKNNTKSGGE